MTPALVAAKLALGPVLLAQARRVRRTALRLPEAEGPREGVVGEGAPVLRVLVVGDSSAAGVGVADQAQAFALPLAKALHAQLGGAVAWQLVARTGVNAAEARELLRQSPLRDAEVAVVTLGVNDVSGQTPPAQYLRQLDLLWQELRARTGARWALFNGLPPMQLLPAVPHPLRWYLGRCAAGLDRALRAWTARQQLGYCALDWSTDRAVLARDGYHPGAQLYSQWAARVAGLILGARPSWARAA